MTISKSKLKKISHKVRHKEALSDDEMRLVQDWRSLHSDVLNTWQALLRRRIASLKMKKSVKLAQRLKRYPTMIHKLGRYDMCLTRMHDIAGCRLIFKNIDDLNKFRDDLHNNSRFKHELISGDKYNYIRNPKPDGYRGIHDVYRCYKPGSPMHNLQVEIQYRTLDQHVWSTTVEALGMITGQHIKFDNSEEKYVYHFKLCSEIFARAFEGKLSCFPNKSNMLLLFEYLISEFRTGVLKKLVMLKVAVNRINKNKKNAFILEFVADNPKEKMEVIIEQFSSDQLAVEAYKNREKNMSAYQDIVMVKADNFNVLKKLFPNYFLETSSFQKQIVRSTLALVIKLDQETSRFNLAKRMLISFMQFILTTPKLLIYGSGTNKKIT